MAEIWMAATTLVSVGLSVASTIEQKKAANKAAGTATQVANYNASLDRSEAQQIDLDTQTNIDGLRRDASTYMSRQVSSYVGAGVMANTGSPLVVQAATAGRFAMREQQMWADSQAKEQRLESAAQAGIAEGAAQADQYHMQGTAAILSGASKVASQLYGGYQGGAFSSGGGTPGVVGTGTTNLSAGLDGGVGP